MKDKITYPRETFNKQTENSILTVTEQMPGIFIYEISVNVIDFSNKSFASTKDAKANCVKAYHAKLSNEIASLKEQFPEVVS